MAVSLSVIFNITSDCSVCPIGSCPKSELSRTPPPPKKKKSIHELERVVAEAQVNMLHAVRRMYKDQAGNKYWQGWRATEKRRNNQ